MRYYEVLYIVNPNYEQERLEEVIKEVGEKIVGYKFSVINHRIWGKKRLAYPIEKHKYGTYVLLQFETDSLDRLVNFERFMELHKVIMRNHTVRLTERPKVYSDTLETEEKSEGVKAESATEKTKQESPDKTESQTEKTTTVEKSETVEKEVNEQAEEEQPEKVQE